MTIGLLNFAVVIGVIITFTDVNALLKKNESYYCNKYCENLGGESEFSLPDRTRADCVTKKYAYECDWASKWAECVGQAQYYGIVLDKEPICALIVRENEQRFVERARTVGDKYFMSIETIER